VDRTILTQGAKPDHKIRNADPKYPYPFTENSTRYPTSITQFDKEEFKESPVTAMSPDTASLTGIATKAEIKPVFASSPQTLYYCRSSFFLDSLPFPYLPPSVRDLLRKRYLTEKQKVRLMTSIAKHAIEHFELHEGTFVAINFKGQIVEVAHKKVELLKKMQRIPSHMSIFVWEVGSDSFSGWY